MLKTRWLLCGDHNPPSQLDQCFFKSCDIIDKYLQKYKTVLLTGDFSVQDSQLCLSDFLFECKTQYIVYVKTCFKNLRNSSCFYTFLTNSPLMFLNTRAVFKHIKNI